MYAAIAIAGIILGCLFIVWRLIASAKATQKEASEQRGRAESAESSFRDAEAARRAERDAEQAAREISENKNRNPFDFR